MPNPTPVRLFSPLSNRTGNVLQDSRLYNGYVEKDPEYGGVWICKRPGFSLYSSVVGSPAVGQGVTNWLGDIYSVFGNTLYKNTTSIGAITGSGFYYFSSCRGATPKLVIKSTSTLYTYDASNGLVNHTAATNYPSITVPGVEYIDGYTVVFDSHANIWTSSINDPTTWGASDYLVAQIEQDAPIFLSKQLAYIIAFKGISTEVFWDAGNATGSPLAPILGSKVNVGCVQPYTVRNICGDLAWIGSTRSGNTRVMVMSAAQAQRISTPPIERFMDAMNYTTSQVSSWSATMLGHDYYAVSNATKNTTIVFDLTEKTWYFWTDPNGNYLPIVDSTYDNNANPIFQHVSNGNLYTFDHDNPSDTDDFADDFSGTPTPFPFDIFTSSWDGGLRVNKTVTSVEVVGDQVASTVNVSWSDDDQKTFSSPISLSLDQHRPMFQDGSTFRRRAWHINNLDSNFFRLKRLDLSALPGTF